MLSFPALCLQATTTFLETYQASAVTISRRMPILANLALWPEADDILEANRMIVEKFEAMTEGAIAASERMADLGLRAMMGKADAEDIASGMLSIAVAAAKPARLKARANARRLSRKAR